jgi:hypothetical protein
LKGQRDRALLLLTFACAMRRAEAAALDVADPGTTAASRVYRESGCRAAREQQSDLDRRRAGDGGRQSDRAGAATRLW